MVKMDLRHSLPHLVELTIRGCVRTDQFAELYALLHLQATTPQLHERYVQCLASMAGSTTADLVPDSLDLLELNHHLLIHLS